MTHENIFSLLASSGPFATGDRPPALAPFSPEARLFAKGLAEAGMATRYRILRNQIFEFLDVRTFAEIQAIINDPARRKLANERAYRLLGNMFGIEGNAREVILRVNTYSRTADGVINYLKAKVLANYASYIEMTNEIDSCKSPVDLLLILFDDRYHKKARFEAKRKLILMNLAGSIDQRERETEVEAKFDQFLDFLNEYVWSKKSRIGELEIVYLLSDHDPETFACTKVEVVGQGHWAYGGTAAKVFGKEVPGVKKKANQKLTLIKRRRFQANGVEVPIYVSIRKKQSETKVLKLLRKGEENPAVAVDDELGLMGVVDSVAEVKAFQKHLTQSATKAGSLMTLEEVSDTLSSGGHHSGSIGSSAKTQMFKFFARMGGMRVEFIVHTNRSYLNYIYEREVSHDEYEVKRIFDSGVAQLLFPQDIYEIDIAEKKEAVLRWFRKRIEEF
ncbi:MAG: hypothetical protein NT087_00230 [Deltaproteobacteria bacterium]|nr:hypothetical protein [Deltaproteobacteria bacterium]